MPEDPSDTEGASPDPSDTRFTPESAREAGRKGGKARWEKEKLRRSDPDAYIAETFQQHRAELTDALLSAALGKNEWHELPLDKRLAALTKALDYAIGRPAAQKAAPVGEQPPIPEEKPKQGLALA